MFSAIFGGATRLIRGLLSAAFILLGVVSCFAQGTALSNLPAGSAVSGGDLFYDVQTPGVGGVKVTGTQLSTFLFGQVHGGCTSGPSGSFSCPLGVGTQPITGGVNGDCLITSSGLLGQTGCGITGLTIGTTSISGGINGDCLSVNGSLVGQVACLSTLVIGTTAISGGTNGNCLNITSGKLGQQTCGGGGSTSILNISRAQIPSTNLGANVTVMVNGYLNANDLGFGAVYSSVGSPSCTNGLMYIKDSGNVCFVMVPPTTGLGYEPGWFGAKADDCATTLVASDVTNNPQWRGTYTTGMCWDYVGMQEAVYASWAGTSTASPRTINWNTVTGNQALNVPLYVPPGVYGVANRITANMQGGRVIFAERQQARIDWVGSGTSPDYAFYCDGCSYSFFENFSVSGPGEDYPNQVGLFSLDWSGNINSLKTQQNTLINLYCATSTNGRCFDISPSGGGAQGDTLTFINPVCLSFGGDWCFRLTGANTIGNVIIGGDMQGFNHDGIQSNGANISVFGMHSENQSTGNLSPASPMMSQNTLAGADYHIYNQVQGSGPAQIVGWRAEDEILAIANGVYCCLFDGVSVQDSMNTLNSIGSWVATTSFQEGTVITGTDGRFFMTVDGGGTDWRNITSYTSNVITDSGASYTAGQWVGYNILVRFGSNGFFQQCDITANTATTITIDAACNPGNGGQSMYAILGISAGSAPAFSGLGGGTQANYPSNFGFSTNGTTCINGPGGASVGNYVAIPNARTVGKSGTDNRFPTVFTAKITAAASCGAGFGNYTVNRTPNVNVTNAPGWFGPVLTDGTKGIRWMQLPWDAIGPVNSIVNVNLNGGSVVSGGPVAGLVTPGNTQPYDFTFGSGNALGNGNATASTNPTQTVSAGAHQFQPCAPLPTTTPQTLSIMANCNFVNFTPTQATTLNAGPNQGYVQEFTLQILTSGTTSFVVTFGTGFVSSGTLTTGTVSGKNFTVKFIFNVATGNWVEASRVGPI